MSMFRLFGVNSAIYTATNFLQKGAVFLLLPLYTQYLDPAAYGVLAIVTAINGFLSLAFTLNMMGAVTRFYFEYQDEPAMLAEFWGSVLSFVLLLSAVVGALLLVVGDKVLRPFIGSVPFWPYVALGVVTAFFQPFVTTYLGVLQARNQAARYAFISLSHFGLMTALTIALVVFLKWGVTGALVATLAAAIAFFIVALWSMRPDVRFCLRWRHVRPALSYSLPQVPHLVACQTTAIADRMILNTRLGPAAAGIYSVGAMISMVVEIAAASVNRAYMPLSMSALKSGHPTALAQIRAMGALVVAAFCLCGAFFGSYARELVALATTPAFAAAASVVPLLVFGGVAGAIYYLFVNILFFDRAAIKLLPIATLSAAALNLALALFLIPRFGLIGAATATLLAQISSTVLTAVIARRFDPIRWDYGRYTFAFAVSFGFSWLLSNVQMSHLIVTILAKMAGVLTLAVLLGFILWRRPLIFGEAAFRLMHGRPAEAAALFIGT